jgi:hypothetical protein
VHRRRRLAGGRAHRPATTSLSLAVAAALTSIGAPARAVDVPLGDESLVLDISNTSQLSYRFDNRNDQSQNALVPLQQVDDFYGEWLNRLYVRSYYDAFSVGVRLDSAVYANKMTPEEVRAQIIGETGTADLDLETRFGRELHSRFNNVVYPSKLWVGFKHGGLDVTAGDFYLQLGRGLVFGVRKIDEVGIDTTVRGGKLRLQHDFGGASLEGVMFGGQLNPIRIDYPTGRILYGSGSPLFFGFPEAGDFRYFADDGDVEPTTDRGRPSYLEDNTIGGSLTLRTKRLQLGYNVAALMRQSNSDDFQRCTQLDGRPIEECVVENPTFQTPDASRARDRVFNMSQSLRLPPIEDVFDAYVEIAEQRQFQGRVISVNNDGSVAEREQEINGFAAYGNVNLRGGPLSTTFEVKHYRSFFPLGSNIDFATVGFAAPEFNVVNYSQPPTAESIFIETIGARDVCVTGGRGRADLRINEHAKLFGWLGRFASWSEVDPTNNFCSTEDKLQSNTWETTAGLELEFDKGTHYWTWLGGRFSDLETGTQPTPGVPGETEVVYREVSLRYDMQQHIAGDFSVSMLGRHRRRFDPKQSSKSWNEGENLLALNWNPHFAFIFGNEYQTRQGFAPTYFNGAIQYRSKDNTTWHGMLTDSVRLFVGQQRAALRCIAGVCRIFPAFEGGRFELVSRF